MTHIYLTANPDDLVKSRSTEAVTSTNTGWPWRHHTYATRAPGTRRNFAAKCELPPSTFTMSIAPEREMRFRMACATAAPRARLYRVRNRILLKPSTNTGYWGKY